MIFNVSSAGSIGIVKDIESQELPPEAWTDGVNVRFDDGKVYKVDGYSSIFTPSVSDANWITPVQTKTDIYWAYCGTDDIYVYRPSADTHHKITRAAGVYTGTAAARWNGGVLGTVGIFNNGTDVPQSWNPALHGTLLVNLPNWPSGVTAKVIRPYKNFLVGLDITKSGSTYPQMVKWSNPAEAGAVPTTWDQTDTSQNAGEVILADTGGFLVDCLPMRDVNIVYKDSEVYGMQFIGGQLVFRFNQILKTSGLIAQGCAKEFKGQHFVIANDDIILFNGNDAESIIDRRLARTVFAEIDSTNYANCFVVPNYSQMEMWFCYPQGGDTYATKAAIWNWRENTWGFRDLPTTPYISFGVYGAGTLNNWDTDSNAWDTDNTFWGSQNYNPTISELIGIATGNGYKMNDTHQAAGTDITSWVERTNLPLGGHQGKVMVTAVYPRVELGASSTLSVYVGEHNAIEDPVTWSGPFTFTPGTDYKVDCRVTGRYIAIKFEFPGDNSGNLSGYEIEYELAGLR